MKKYLLAVAIAFSASAQLVTSQVHFEVWVKEDGTQGFLLRATFPEAAAEAAELTARGAISRALAEKHWCLRGWSVDSREVVPIDRPKATVVTLSGTCKQ